MRKFEIDTKSPHVEPLEHIKCPIYCHRTFYMPCCHDKESHKYGKNAIKCKFLNGVHYDYHKRKMYIICNFDEGDKNVLCSRPPYKEKPYYSTITS